MRRTTGHIGGSALNCLLVALFQTPSSSSPSLSASSALKDATGLHVNVHSTLFSSRLASNLPRARPEEERPRRFCYEAVLMLPCSSLSPDALLDGERAPVEVQTRLCGYEEVESHDFDFVFVSVKGQEALQRALLLVNALLDQKQKKQKKRVRQEKCVSETATTAEEEEGRRSKTVVVPIMNGLAHVEPFIKLQKELFHSVWVVFASTSLGCYWNRNRLIQAGNGMTTLIIPDIDHDHSLNLALRQASVDEMANAMNELTNLFERASAKVNVVPYHELKHVMWKKLSINCVINPLTALYDLSNAFLVYYAASDVGRRVIRSLLREVIQAAATDGVHLIEEEVYETLMYVVQATANNTSSMKSDYQRGRCTEINSINGAIICRINAPMNSFLYKAIQLRVGCDVSTSSDRMKSIDQLLTSVLGV